MSAIDLKTYDILSKHFNKEEAQIVLDFVEYKAEKKNTEKDLATKADLYKVVFLSGLLQVLAVLGGLITLLKFVNP